MAKQPLRIPVTRRAVLQRINRKLAHQGERLLVSRSQAEKAACGDYYRVNSNNHVTSPLTTSLEEEAKALGVLRPWETIEDEGSQS